MDSIRSGRAQAQTKLDNTFFLNFGKKGELKEQIADLKRQEKETSKKFDASQKGLAKAEQTLDQQKAAADKQVPTIRSSRADP